jgi:bacteriorhodopsin
MEMLNFIFNASVETGDFVGFTFFIGSVSMLAATVWFLMQHGEVDKKFKDSMLVAALITGIAAVHYFYMREQWVAGYGDILAAGDDATKLAAAFEAASPTELRYIDWILTVPLMVVEFALLTGVGMRKLFWASVVMLVAGYFGESGVTGVMDAQSWGAISGLAYFWMAYEVGCLSIFGGPSGSVGKALSGASGKIPQAGRMLQWFVLVGWAIYPIGYMAGTDGWYDSAFAFLNEGSMNIIYNVGDAINKIGFGMAVWYAAKS